MVEYSKLNVKLTDAQLKKLKTAVKKNAGTTLRMIFKMANGSILPHVLFLTTRQRAKLRNAFNNNMSTDIKLSKAQISKIAQSGEFLGSLLSILAVPLIKVPVILAINILGITAAASATDAGIQKKTHGSGKTTLIISNEEMNDSRKLLNFLKVLTFY